jgi:hypothetical protein
MPGRYEDITKMGCTLTEPSQMSEMGPREGEQTASYSLLLNG